MVDRLRQWIADYSVIHDESMDFFRSKRIRLESNLLASCCDMSRCSSWLPNLTEIQFRSGFRSTCILRNFVLLSSQQSDPGCVREERFSLFESLSSEFNISSPDTILPTLIF